MALVKFGGGVTQMSGSIGGTTFARNRSGNYARSRTKPVNPNTSGQQTARNAMADLTTRWSSTLTTAQRTAWNLYGSSVLMTNRLGENINLTGFNHYVRSNSIALQQGETLVDDGPTIFELPQADGTLAVAGSEASQELTITYDDTVPWANEDDGHLFVFQGTPQNGQRNFFNGPWRFLATEDGLLATPPTSPLVAPAVFVITESQRVWIYARIWRADGRLSQPFRADIAIGA